MRKWAAVVIWIFFVGVGLRFLWSYENRAAKSLKASLRIPASHSISLDSQRPTIVVFAHPHCPCSRASLAELERVLGTYSKKFSVRIFFYLPKGKSEEWAKSDLWRSASRFPTTAVFFDREGVEAKRFQATTSGETFVYDPEGAMLYHGGLTASRGHEGDNVGTRSLGEIAREGHSQILEAPIFGCTLYQDTKQTLGGS